MQSRKYIPEKDYQIAVDWWSGYKWIVPMPQECLPTTGIVVKDNDKPLCMMWVYGTNSAVALVGFPVCDPHLRGGIRSDAIKMCIDCCNELAKEMGFSIVYTYQSNDNLLEKFKDNGFMVGDTKITNMYKGL